MKNILSTARARLWYSLPVPIARRRMKRTAAGAHGQDRARGERQILVDVSTIIRNDARTGIQRVVRALLLQLSRRPPAGFRVRPVFATRNQGYCYAPDSHDLAFPLTSDLAGTDAVSVHAGDIFLGLDLAAHILPRHTAELARWCRMGVEITVFVYDLLPLLHPSWFNPRNTQNIRRWLRTIAILADRLICISQTVKSDLESWLLRKYSLSAGSIPISVIPLGADIESSVPSPGLPESIDQLLQALSGKPTILMVGTLEPRKSHSEVLAAFNELWQKGRDVNFVIIGRSGWKTDSLLRSLRSHPQHRIRLHWLEDASDELLVLLYRTCTGVIIASLSEGFGLSLIEALHYGSPVLARDIPVFREIGGTFVTYFSGERGLSQELDAWLSSIGQKKVPVVGPLYTWENSARELLQSLGLKQLSSAQPQRRECAVTDPQGAIA